MSVGSVLKQVRVMRHLTQKQLASKVNVTESAIRNYELGIRQPSDQQLESISQVLDVSPVVFHFEKNGSAEFMTYCLMKYSNDFSISTEGTADSPRIVISGKSEKGNSLLKILAEWRNKYIEAINAAKNHDESEQWAIEAISSNQANFSDGSH